MSETPIDQAYAALSADPDDVNARLKFYERLADAELFLMLAAEPDDDNIVPEIFDLSDGPYVLAFDREERLAAFAERPVAHAALSGRALVKMIVGQGIGVGLNLGASSEYILPPTIIEWLSSTLTAKSQSHEARPVQVHKPSNLPKKFIEGLNVKLTSAMGLARAAWLVRADYEHGNSGHLLVFVGGIVGAHGALTQAVSEVLVFSGVEAGQIDIAFFDEDDPVLERIAKVGLRFDVPERAAPKPLQAPGTDPDRPPRLR